MSRLRERSLRGSIMQSSVHVRMRPKQKTRFGILFRLGALTGSLLIIIGLGIWLWHIGWPQKQVERASDAALHLTQRAQFAVKEITVEGRLQTSKDELFSALGIGAGAPILSFDPVAAHDRIAKLPWVADAVVERHLPDTIYVRLVERVPIARWQHDGQTVVIASTGTTLPDAKLAQFAALPLVVGVGAPAQTQYLLDALKNYPDIQRNMKAAVRVSDRRWDLWLQPKITARLPEEGIDGALKHLSQLISEQNILERNVVTIDLRIPDRLIIEQGGGKSHSAGEPQL